MKVMAPQQEKAAKSGWSKPVAKPGEELFLVARLVGYQPGTTVTFRVFPTSGSAGSSIANLKAVSDDRGLALAEYVYVHDPIKVKDPRLIFEANVEGVKALSNVLTIVDWIELQLTDEQGKPVAGKEVQLVDALGYLHLKNTDPNGILLLEKIAAGDAMFKIPGWTIVGETRTGEKKFRSGQRHRVTVREMKFTVEFESPKNGDVYLAGDKIQIKASVKRVGQPWDGEVQFSANNGARITGGRTAGQKLDTAAQTLVLPAKDGTVELQGKYDNVTTTVKLKVVRPYVSEIQLEGPDAFKLFEHKTQSMKAGSAAFSPAGDVKAQHLAAFRFGKKLKGKIKVASPEALTAPAKIEVAVVTPALDDTGLPANGIDKLAGKPLALRLPADKREAGAEFKGGEEGTWIEVESDRPLPNAVRAYTWNLEVRLNQRGAKGWATSDANLPIWPKIGELRGFQVVSVFGEAQVADGKDLDPGTVPVKRSEFDPFHVKLAATWAAGAFNLLMNDARSIPAKIAEATRHLKWPAEYDGLRGKPAADHPRPLNFANLQVPGIYEGGGKACPCGGTVDANGCSACGKLVATETRSKATLPAGKMAWDASTKSYKCGGCGRAVPANPKLGPDGTVICPFENAPKHLIEARCPACGEFVTEKALATGEHVCPAGDATAPTTEPTSKNWGFAVITNPTHPGGKVHQRASLVASALGVLGVKSSILYLRPRPGGAVNTVEHDPVTRGAVCFNPKDHWGRPLLAFVGIPVDKSRDGDYQGVKLHEDDTYVLEVITKKRGLHKDAAITGHERKLPDPKAFRENSCRCGHPYRPESVKEQNLERDTGNNGGDSFTFETLSKLALEFTSVQIIGGGAERAIWVQVDGGSPRLLEVGRKIELGPVSQGAHKVAIQTGVSAAGKGPKAHYKLKVYVTFPAKGDKPVPCPTCDAQVMWAYKCAKCGARVAADQKGNHSCGSPLEGLFVQALIYPCPNCKRTVHDGDAECWGCGAKLQARKPEERFGQPAAATATGGEKKAEKKAEEEQPEPQPIGRFDLNVGSWHAVLTLNPAGQPSFINFGYFHDGFSREDAKEVKWDEKTRTLTFVRIFENRTRQDYRLVFKPDGSFTGNSAQAGPLTGGVRPAPDAAPQPEGRFDILTLENRTRAHLTITGRDPNNLQGVVNYGVFHPGFAPEQLRDVKWDAQNHTLTYYRPNHDQRTWLTFRDGGRSFNGVFTLRPSTFWSFKGSKL